MPQRLQPVDRPGPSAAQHATSAPTDVGTVVLPAIEQHTRSFTKDLTAVANLRAWAAQHLAPADLGPYETGAALLIVNELIANAIDHAAGPRVLTIVRQPELVRLEVSDGSWEKPTVRRPTPTEARGRGLVLIDHLASRWGFDRTATGKIVWAEVDRSHPPRRGYGR